MKNEVMLAFKCNHLIVKGLLFSRKKSFLGKTIFVLHFTDEFFSSEMILLIDTRNMPNSMNAFSKERNFTLNRLFLVCKNIYKKILLIPMLHIIKRCIS